MMRSGRLLAEESPKNLLRNSRRPSLEDAFLKLCMDEINDSDEQSTVVAHCTSNEDGQTSATVQPDDNITTDNSCNQVDIHETDTGRVHHTNGQASSATPADLSVSKNELLI